VRLDGDLTRLAQVVSNLLNNAAKYTPPGGRIEIGARVQGGDVLLHVRDNGAGIPAEMLPHVFDLFSQVDRTIQQAQGGLGIGLWLVKKLVELHHGSIEAHSAGLGQGSTFTLRLPTRRE
jgi:signal transduction histidine kinase